tara:strand:- start:446 stop:865 length:420 start_codon:yes stop_codon:yes gene_type:complete
MRSYTVEIKKDLNELVDDTIDEIKRAIAWLVSEGEIDESMDNDSIMEVLEYDGTKHEIIDGAVPVYTHELEALMFVHKWTLMEAFEDAGICSVDEVLKNPDSFVLGIEGVAVYCYIEQEVNAWIDEDLDDWFNEKFGGN